MSKGTSMGDRRLRRLLSGSLLIFLVSATPLAARAKGGATEPAQLLLQANSAYDAGDYEQAVSRYSELLSASPNGFLYFNLGNAELRAGRVGRAIAAYRKASQLLPRNQDIRANLTYARKLTKDAISPPEPSPVLRTLLFWHYRFSQRELLFMLAGVSLLFWVVMSFRLFGRRSEVLRWAAALLLLLLVAVGASYAVHRAHPVKLGVVDRAEINVHSGTSRETVVRFRLHEGTEVELLDLEQDWARIVLQDGNQGWVERDELLLIES